METFFTALVGASVGALVVSAFLPTGKLRRSPKEAAVLFIAAVLGAGGSGLATGDLEGGVLTGLAMGFAFVTMPGVVLAFRAGNAHDPSR